MQKVFRRGVQEVVNYVDAARFERLRLTQGEVNASTRAAAAGRIAATAYQTPPLEDCARRNGVVSGALDVGVDASGALGGGVGGAVLTPLPPEAPPRPVEVLRPADPPPSAASAPAPSAPVAVCWRHGGGEWKRLPGEMTQSACVQALFAGRCERLGQAAYGRWGGQTLRLVPGKVEVSGDNRNFRLLAE